MKDFVSIKQLADELRMDRSHARRFVIKEGFTFQKMRTEDSRNQLTLCLSREEAEKIKTHRKELGFGLNSPIENQSPGYFYVIQLIPDLSPSRLKLGHAENVHHRLASHRCSAPTASILKNWPCKKSWEQAAIDCAKQETHIKLGFESFDFKHPKRVIDKLDAFFSSMNLGKN